MRLSALLVLTACVHPVGTRHVGSPPEAWPAAAAPAASPASTSPWAEVPVRVMAWTPEGVQQVGALPGALPDPLPARWYVEPVGALDAARFGRLIELVRQERIPGLSLRRQPVTPYLAALRDLPALGALILDATGVDGAALAPMQLELTRLYLAQTPIDDAAAQAIAQRYPALEVLDLEGTAIGDAGARAIASLATLRAVNLAGTQITDEGGAALGALHQLEIADLGNTQVAGRTLAALRGLPIRELFLDHTRVRGVEVLAGLAPRLVRFDISSTPHHPTDAELAWLTGATQLIELGVSGAKLSDALALPLAKLPRLRHLRMAETAITLATIRAIAARTDLGEIDLAGTPVDDESAARMLAAPHLRILRLDSTPITDAGLMATPGPALVELYLSRTAVSDAGTALLSQLPQLAALGLGHTRIGEASIERIARLAGLHTLVLSSVPVSSAALARLGALTGLERLYLDRDPVDDLVLEALAPARSQLRVLHLAGSEVSEDGLSALRRFSELEELTIGDTRVQDGIADLAAWPHLRTLSLTGLQITDKALPGLAARSSLTVLDLSATDVRDPSPLTALPHLRTLGIAQTRLSAAGRAALQRLTARGVEVIR